MTETGSSLKILFAASEAYPLMKTGGLGDVAGSLPVALRNLGNDVRLLMPAYPASKDQVQTKPRATLPLAEGDVQVLETTLPGTRLTTWLIDYPPLFERRGNPYVDPEGKPWSDNAQRFALLARAIVALSLDQAGIDWRADIVHCNDWQTGLAPALLHAQPSRPATVFTIHNLAYQGLFPFATFQALDLPAELWAYDALEFHGQLSFIKGGLVYADRLTTVSPTYATEIQHPSLGYGLEGLLQHRKQSLHGILNGIDEQVWDPERDEHIVKQYTWQQLDAKQDNKLALQAQMQLPQAPQIPLFGIVSRLVEQKGIDILARVIPHLPQQACQFAILGTGNAALEHQLRLLAEQYPDRISVYLGYDEKLAHLIEAGADLFLMPSRFEPCGLNQMYSLRYGTLPLVHRVGGLADTVVDANDTTLADHTANGFVFDEPTPEALQEAIERALQLYTDKTLWKQLQIRGMQTDFSWQQRAREYEALYRDALSRRHPAAKAGH